MKQRWQEFGLAAVALAFAVSCSSNAANSQCGSAQVTVSPGMAKTPAHLTATSSFDTRGLEWQRSWKVSRAGDPMPVGFQASDPSQTTVTADVNTAGSYHFEMTATHADQRCTASGDSIVTTPSAKSAAWLLRVTPSVASGLPRQDATVVMYAATPLDHQSFTLAGALSLDGTLTDGNVGVPGTVRLTADSGNDLLAAAGSDGRFSVALLATDKYTPVLVPESLALAPTVGKAVSGAALVGGQFVVTAGAAVAGTVRDGAGQPVVGARVVLHSGAKPSSVGITDGSGAYKLRAEAGAGWVMTVQSDGRPEIDSAPLAVKDGSVIDVAWSQLPLYAVASKVVADDGATAMGGARVSVRTVKVIDKAARVTADGIAGDATGQVRGLVKSAQDGSLPPLALPAGDYDLVTQPPDGALDGVTATRLTVSQATTWTIKLAPRTQLKGHVTDEAGLAVTGASVTAVPIGGLGASPQTITDGNGNYAIALDAALGADLFVDPPLFSDRHLRRAHSVIAPGQSNADLMVAAGLLLRGAIQSPSGNALAGAGIEAYCAVCNDATAAAVAATASDGTFTMYLPDPGP